MTDKLPWATIVLVALTVVAALTGAGVVLWGQPGALSFEDYLNDLAKFAGAIGLLGIGRGIRTRLTKHG